MEYRNEWKQEINFSDMVILRQRLNAVMQKDSNASDGRYVIRSLYFDNMRDKALVEKINGVNKREKFRIRMYNDESSVLFLEKKSKVNGLCLKDRAAISKAEAEKIILGDCEFMMSCGKELVKELCFKMRTQGLKPKTIVEYTREPFIMKAGNVRVTIDSNIRTGIFSTDFFNPDCITVPVVSSASILEVKWDEFLPDVVRDIVQLKSRHTSSFSKYAVCRIYG